MSTCSAPPTAAPPGHGCRTASTTSTRWSRSRSRPTHAPLRHRPRRRRLHSTDGGASWAAPPGIGGDGTLGAPGRLAARRPTRVRHHEPRRPAADRRRREAVGPGHGDGGRARAGSAFVPDQPDTVLVGVHGKVLAPRDISGRVVGPRWRPAPTTRHRHRDPRPDLEPGTHLLYGHRQTTGSAGRRRHDVHRHQRRDHRRAHPGPGGVTDLRPG